METLAVEKTPPPPNKKMKNPKRNGLHPLDDLHGYHHNYPQFAAMKQGVILMHGGHTRSHGGGEFSPHNNYPPKTHPPLLPLPVVVSKPPFLSPPPHPLSKSKQQKGKRVPRLTKSDDVVKGKKGRPSMQQRVGSDPGNDPKKAIGLDMRDKFSGSSSAFSLSPPPPSSLPMPKFSLIRQPQSQLNKLSSAVEVDDGATDNLRRLLRLR